MATSNLQAWLIETVARGASDLHVNPGSPPIVRRHGQLVELGFPVLDAESACRKLMEHCPEKFRKKFEGERNLDFAFEIDNGNQQLRFRANYFYAGDNLGACFRYIPSSIPDLAWANFPLDLAERIVGFKNGLVLFSGVAGSGKTTSLAMLIEMFIRQGGYRIITIEEPIEYLFKPDPNSFKSSVVTQREVGVDVKTFADGLKYGLRQDPDIILVGEIRDRDTAQIALSAAETGHLVLSTLHSRDAKGAISRYSDLFAANRQDEIRAQLALSLRAVVSQHLLPSSIPESKRELAIEVLFNNSPISAAIRQGRLETMDTSIQTGAKDGMVSLNESIKRLMNADCISRETANAFATDVAYLNR